MDSLAGCGLRPDSPASRKVSRHWDNVAAVKDGRILIVEYKGKPFLNDDTREKENIGQLWEEKSQGKGLFLLATWMDAEGRHTQRQIDEKILRGKAKQ
jgi:type III restriction enzyme